MRKLASIRRIDKISPIEGADRILLASVDGWNVIVAKDMGYREGDKIVYLEVDSFLPVRPQYEFLRGTSFRSTTWGGDGFRIKTMKMRGFVSQGLIIPISALPVSEEYEIGDDVTDVLEIKKWDPPPPMDGKVRGSFPSFLKKTDQERAQNLVNEISQRDDSYEVTLKLDGSSITFFVLDGELRVCSRNLELDMSDVGNPMVRTISDIFDKKLLEEAEGLFFQGEIMGPGVQGNREGLREHLVYVYNSGRILRDHTGYPYDCAYHAPHERRDILALFQGKVNHVPVVTEAFWLPRLEKEEIITFLLTMAKTRSIMHDIAEGLVFKSNDDSSFSFKIINNEYLLKCES